MEKTHPRYLRPARSISVSAVPFGPGIDIWRLVGLVGWCLVLSVLIIAGSVTSGGRNVVMVLPRGLGRVLRRFFLMSYYRSCITLLGLLVHRLLVHFPFGIVLLVLLVEPLLGGYQCLDMLLVWLLLIWRWLRVASRDVHWVSGSGPGRKRIRLNRKTHAHIVGFSGPISATCLEEIASCGAFICFHS